MSEETKENGILIFILTVMVALSSTAFYILAEEKKMHAASEQKCESAGWTWLHDEAKCIMAKEVK